MSRSPSLINNINLTNQITVLPEIEKFEIKDLSSLFEFQNYSEKDFTTSNQIFDKVEIFLKKNFLFKFYKEDFIFSLEFETLNNFLKNEKKFVKRIDYILNDDSIEYNDLNLIHLCNNYCNIYQKDHFFSPRLSIEDKKKRSTLNFSSSSSSTTKTPRFEKK